MQTASSSSTAADRRRVLLITGADTHADWLAEGDRIGKSLDHSDLTDDEAERQYAKMADLYDKVASTPATDRAGLLAQLRLVEREVADNDAIPSWTKDALQSVLTAMTQPTPEAQA